MNPEDLKKKLLHEYDTKNEKTIHEVYTNDGNLIIDIYSALKQFNEEFETDHKIEEFKWCSFLSLACFNSDSFSNNKVAFAIKRQVDEDGNTIRGIFPFIDQDLEFLGQVDMRADGTKFTAPTAEMKMSIAILNDLAHKV